MQKISSSTSFFRSCIVLIIIFCFVSIALLIFSPERDPKALKPTQEAGTSVSFDKPKSGPVRESYAAVKEVFRTYFRREVGTLRIQAITSIVLLMILISIVLHWRTIYLIHANLYSQEARPGILPSLPPRLSPPLLFHRPATWRFDDPRISDQNPTLRLRFLLNRCIYLMSFAIGRMTDLLFAIPEVLYRLYRNLRWYQGLISTRTIGRLIFLFFRPLPDFNHMGIRLMQRTISFLAQKLAKKKDIRFASVFSNDTPIQISTPLFVSYILSVFLSATLAFLYLEPGLANRSTDLLHSLTIGLPQPWGALVLLLLIIPVGFFVLDLVVSGFWLGVSLLNSNLIFQRARIYTELAALYPLKSSDATTHEDEIGRQYVIRARQLSDIRGAKFDSNIKPIVCGNIFDIHNCQEAIQVYFESLREIHSETALRSLFQLARRVVRSVFQESSHVRLTQFICPVSVSTGYLCPTYLVSGLLSEYDEDWRKIIWSARDSELHMQEGDRLFFLPELRKLQAFIWNCWVQWGPSIPISDSTPWLSEDSGDQVVALQYGYGDENNSLLVAWSSLRSFASLYGHWEELQCKRAMEQPAEDQVPVIAAGVTGKLIWNVDKELVSGNCLPRPQRDRGHGRAVLFVGDSESEKQQNETPVLSHDANAIIPRFESAPFYSAYIWVMFAICDRSTGKPVYSKKDTEWKGLIPFFQHGNIACQSVYRSIKRELAAKVVDTIEHILESSNEIAATHLAESNDRTKTLLPENLCFAYVCAFDDNGDGARSIVSLPLNTNETIRGLLEQELDERGDQAANFRSRILLNNEFKNVFAAHDIPEAVSDYMDSINEGPALPDMIVINLRTVAREAGYWDKSKPAEAQSGLLASAFLAFAKLYYDEFSEGDERESLEVFIDRVLVKSPVSPWTQILLTVKARDWEEAKKDNSKRFNAYGFVVTEWYPESQCGLVAYIADNKRARQQGFARDLLRKAARLLWEMNGCRNPVAILAEVDYTNNFTGVQKDRLISMGRLSGRLIPLGTCYRQPALRIDSHLAQDLVLLSFDVMHLLELPERAVPQHLHRNEIQWFLSEYFKCHQKFNPAENDRTKPDVSKLLDLNIDLKEANMVKVDVLKNYGVKSIDMA